MTKSYSNRFSSMEKQSDNTWIVFNDVSGLPIYNADGTIKRFNFQSARIAMNGLYTHYISLR